MCIRDRLDIALLFGGISEHLADFNAVFQVLVGRRVFCADIAFQLVVGSAVLHIQ